MVVRVQQTRPSASSGMSQAHVRLRATGGRHQADKQPAVRLGHVCEGHAAHSNTAAADGVRAPRRTARWLHKQMRAGAVRNILPHTIDLLSICCRNEYSAWAGLIVTQYGQVSRNLQDRPTLGYTGSGAPDNPSQTAIAQLRAHYGLSPATSPTATAGRAAAPS